MGITEFKEKCLSFFGHNSCYSFENKLKRDEDHKKDMKRTKKREKKQLKRLEKEKKTASKFKVTVSERHYPNDWSSLIGKKDGWVQDDGDN